jgi:hypothetical protein
LTRKNSGELNGPDQYEGSQTQEVLFEFQVQLRTSERMMPIEDASVEWPANRPIAFAP